MEPSTIRHLIRHLEFVKASRCALLVDIDRVLSSNAASSSAELRAEMEHKRDIVLRELSVIAKSLLALSKPEVSI